MKRSLLLMLALALTVACGGPAPESSSPAPGTTAAPSDTAEERPNPAILRPLGVTRVEPEPLPSAEGPQVDRAREYTRMFYDGELEALHAKFSDEMKETIPLPKLLFMRSGTESQLGSETELLSEDIAEDGDYTGYRRRVRFAKSEEVYEVIWAMRDTDTIGGFMLRPEETQDATSPPDS